MAGAGFLGFERKEYRPVQYSTIARVIKNGQYSKMLKRKPLGYFYRRLASGLSF